MKTAVTEKGIILDAMRVRAALDGRLTQIRVRVKHDRGADRIVWVDNGVLVPQRNKVRENYKGWVAAVDKLNGLHLPLDCPYAIGTRLWVRETWQHENGSCDDARCGNPDHIYYRATDPAPDTFAHWRPTSHMPKWASRLTLEVKAVRVERVNEISIDDVLASGITPADQRGQYWREETGEKFAEHYDSLHGPGSFAAGHWVWVLEVERNGK